MVSSSSPLLSSVSVSVLSIFPLFPPSRLPGVMSLWHGINSATRDTQHSASVSQCQPVSASPKAATPPPSAGGSLQWPLLVSGDPGEVASVSSVPSVPSVSFWEQQLGETERELPGAGRELGEIRGPGPGSPPRQDPSQHFLSAWKFLQN